MARTAAELTAERGQTHGDYPTMSGVTMEIMRAYQASPNWASLPDGVQVFLFNNAQKCARILTGNPYEPDHYDDIMGYASLARKIVAPEPEPEPTSEAASDTVVSGIDLEADQARRDAEFKRFRELVATEMVPGGSLRRPDTDSVQGSLDGAATTAVPLAPSGTALEASSALQAAVEGRSEASAETGEAKIRLLGNSEDVINHSRWPNQA